MRKLKWLNRATVVLCVGASAAGAQRKPAQTNATISLQAPNPLERARAFARLHNRDVASVVGSAGLRDLLLRENRAIDSINARGIGAGIVLGEDYLEYVSNLLLVCLKSCDRADPLVIRAFATTPYNYDSQLAEMLATDFGPQVTPIILERARDGNMITRESAVEMLGTLHEKGKRLSDAQRATIRQVTREGIAEPNSVLRTVSVNVLGRIGGKEDLPLLQRIRRNDMAVAHGPAGTVYPVRMAADSAIARISRRP